MISETNAYFNLINLSKVRDKFVKKNINLDVPIQLMIKNERDPLYTYIYIGLMILITFNLSKLQKVFFVVEPKFILHE